MSYVYRLLISFYQGIDERLMYQAGLKAFASLAANDEDIRKRVRLFSRLFPLCISRLEFLHDVI